MISPDMGAGVVSFHSRRCAADQCVAIRGFIFLLAASLFLNVLLLCAHVVFLEMWRRRIAHAHLLYLIYSDSKT